MYTQTLYPETKQVLDKLRSENLLSEYHFYLAGGTALALQLGHRQSSDLDWFTPNFPKMQLLLQHLHKYKIAITQTAPGTLDCLIDGVKVSFMEYTYPMIKHLIEFDGIKMAHTLDIACMKITAISSRGSKKDFIDLYKVLETITLDELFVLFEKKYNGVQYNKMHILKSLTYFDDAESDPDPDYLEPIEWETVKNTLVQKTQEFTKKLLN